MPRQTALIADDCALTRALHVEILRRAGFRTVIAVCGVDAAEEVQRSLQPGGRRFDLILLDYDMPDGDGPSAARMIRQASSPGQSTPMYCVSSHAVEAIETACRDAGFDGVLSKPLVFDRRLLTPTVRPAAPTVQSTSCRPGKD